MTEAGEIHSRAWIPPSIHNAGEFGFPLLILITYLADYFFLFIALPVFFFLLCIVRKNTYLERPPFDRVADGDDRTNVGESVSQVVEVSVNVLESVVTGPFHSMTWRVYLQDYSEVARSVSLDETWKYSAPWIQRRGLIDIRLIFFSINSMFKRKIELFWIDEAGYARKSLTPKLPRATDTVHASYRITKRTWIFTWPDRDSLPPSVTS